MTFRFIYAFIYLQSLLANIILCAAERRFSCEPEGLSDFSGSSVSKKFACNAGDTGSTSGLGRSPGEGNGNPLQYFLPGESHRQKILASYSLWHRKESDITEHINKIFIYNTIYIYYIYANTYTHACVCVCVCIHIIVGFSVFKRITDHC